MIFLLIIISVLLTFFSISGISLSLTFSDASILVLMPLFLYDIFRKRIIINEYSKLFLIYNAFLLFSSLVNFTTLEGAFLNIFKTSLVSWMFFTWTYSLILRKRISRKLYISLLVLLAVVFVTKTWSEMNAVWAESESGFARINLFKSSLDLNSWGFINLMFFILTAFAWNINFHKQKAAILLFFLGALVLYSFSRTALLLFSLAIVWIFFYVNRFNIVKILSIILSLVVAIAINNYFKFISFDISDAALDFLSNKMNSYKSDLIDVRFYSINIRPIVHNFSEFNVFQFLIGNARGVQHSWLSNSLVVSGLVGFVLYILKYVYAIKYSIRSIKIAKVESKFLLLFLIILLVNDFMTNTTLLVPIAGYISNIILAVFFAETERKRRVYSKLKKNNRVLSL